MKLAIMQPYFFPYVGYFQLMKAVDNWIVFDEVQFIDKGWINRNRILHPNPAKQWQYISLPLSKRGQFDKINKIEIHSDIKWKPQILGKLTVYKNIKAPYYDETYNLVKKCLDNDEKNLSAFLTQSLKIIAKHLNISTIIKTYLEAKLCLEKPNHPGQWALKISEKLGALEYINPLGGHELFIKKEFDEKNIKLSFLEPKLPSYMQNDKKFIPNLSIIDLLFWKGSEFVSNFILNDYKLVRSNFKTD